MAARFPAVDPHVPEDLRLWRDLRAWWMSVRQKSAPRDDRIEAVALGEPDRSSRASTTGPCLGHWADTAPGIPWIRRFLRGGSDTCARRGKLTSDPRNGDGSLGIDGPVGDSGSRHRCAMTHGRAGSGQGRAPRSPSDSDALHAGQRLRKRRKSHRSPPTRCPPRWRNGDNLTNGRGSKRRRTIDMPNGMRTRRFGTSRAHRTLERQEGRRIHEGLWAPGAEHDAAVPHGISGPLAGSGEDWKPIVIAGTAFAIILHPRVDHEHCGAERLSAAQTSASAPTKRLRLARWAISTAQLKA